MENWPVELSGALARIERATVLIGEFERVVEDYEESVYEAIIRGFKIVDEKHVLKLPDPQDLSLPIQASIVLGDTIDNFRKSLDYLVYELARFNQGKEVPMTQFVIASTRKQFENSQRDRLKGLSESQIGVVEKLQPYNGHQWLKQMVDISNADKHRHLTDVATYENLEVIFGINGKADEFPGARVFENVCSRGVDVGIRGSVVDVRILGQYPAIETLHFLRSHILEVLRLFKDDFIQK